jgi:hypothetical protein
MPRRKLKFLGFVLAASIAALSSTASATELAEISTQDRGVTVRAKPVDLATGAGSWTFDIRLDTHSQELADDLVRAAVLIDDAGKPHAALAWDGMAPGGHHRKGVLKFAPISPMPAAVELRIQRPGEAEPRRFRWQLK